MDERGGDDVWIDIPLFSTEDTDIDSEQTNDFAYNYSEYQREYGRSIFDYLYDQSQNHGVSSPVLAKLFHSWFDNKSLDDRCDLLETSYVVPQVSKPNVRRMMQVNIPQNSADIIGTIVAPSIRSQLKVYSASLKCSDALSRALLSLLRNTAKLDKQYKIQPKDPLALPRHYHAAVILTYLAVNNPTQENLEKLQNFARKISGHDVPWAKTLGWLLVAISFTIILTTAVSAMPLTLPLVTNVLAPYLVEAYTAAVVTSFATLVAGVCGICYGHANGLSLWTQTVAKAIKNQNKASDRFDYAEPEVASDFSQ